MSQNKQYAVGPSTLLVLTKHYPFNDGNTPAECFLENEIKILASVFESVLVVATESMWRGNPTCSLPENVSAVALGKYGGFAKVSLVLQGMSLPLWGDKKEKEAFSSDRVWSLRALFKGYYIKKAWKKYSAITSEINKKSFIPTHIYSFWFFDTSLVASWLKQDTGAVSYSRAHRYDLYPERNALNYLPCREYQLKWSDRVFPCSMDGVNYLSKTYIEWKDKICLSYLGTRDLPDCSKLLPSKFFSIVSCSSLTSVKRVLLIAEALKLLKLDGTSIKWTHFGDGPEMSRLKEITKSIPNVFVELKGNIPNEQLLQEYSEIEVDLFINVSFSEGLPISIIEACGHGFPIMATGVGGTPEIVKDGVNGIILPEELSKEELANQIKLFYELPKKKKELMRRASREIWHSSFRISSNARALLDEVFVGVAGKGADVSDVK